MLKLFNNFNLRRHNSFGINAYAKYFLEYTTREDLINFLKDNQKLILENKILFLGRGSNILFTKDFDGIILHSLIDKLEIVEENEDTILLKVGNGIIWDDFVAFAVMNDYKGIENLSLIPGSIGATAVQNIGAYGVEAKDFIQRVDCVDIETGKIVSFSNKECEFEYRGSIFKRKPGLIITYVYYRLIKSDYTPNIAYGNLLHELPLREKSGIKEIRNTIIKIRESKLPDPKKNGNAGSFFKNPIISLAKFNKLKEKYPNIVGFPHIYGRMKIAAGWLIEQCGWKGKSLGQAAVYEKQALVIVNKGKASGDDILKLANEIIKSVDKKFGIVLKPEVVFV